MSSRPEVGHMPGREILGWVPLSAILLEAANDLYLRCAFPGWMTGKLGDIAALIWVPVFLYSCMRILGYLARRWVFPEGRYSTRAKVSGAMRLAAVATTMVVYIAINSFPLAAEMYAGAIDVLDFRANTLRHHYTCDSGDLVCLPALSLSYFYLKRSRP